MIGSVIIISLTRSVTCAPAASPMTDLKVFVNGTTGAPKNPRPNASSVPSLRPVSLLR